MYFTLKQVLRVELECLIALICHSIVTGSQDAELSSSGICNTIDFILMSNLVDTNTCICVFFHSSKTYVNNSLDSWWNDFIVSMLNLKRFSFVRDKVGITLNVFIKHKNNWNRKGGWLASFESNWKSPFWTHNYTWKRYCV